MSFGSGFGGFGQQNNNNTAQPSGFGGFGATNNTPSTGFGAANTGAGFGQTNTTSGGLFGAGNNNTTAGGFGSTTGTHSAESTVVIRD
jgi:nuclear pore complex protein Nup98-Nup96